MSNKWVEVEAKTIDDAIKAGLKELSLEDATVVVIHVITIKIKKLLSLMKRRKIMKKNHVLKLIQKSSSMYQ